MFLSYTTIINLLAWDVSVDVGFCFYEDSLATVKRAIESVRHSVRYIFAIDGKFEFYDSNRELSTDEVREYLRSVPNVVLVDYPNRKENEKRQKYLDLANQFMSDWLLILDADEYITKSTDWIQAYREMKEHFNSELLPKIYGVQIGQKHFFPRLWMRPYLIQYTKTHNFWQFKTPDKPIYKSTIDYPPIHGVYIQGDDHLRDPEYTEKTYRYQKKLMAYEKPFKEQYRKVAKNTKPAKELHTFHGIPMV